MAAGRGQQVAHLPHQLSVKSLLQPAQNPAHLPKGKGKKVRRRAHGCKVWTHKINLICHGLHQRDHLRVQIDPDQDLRKKINNNLIDVVIGDHLVMIIIEDVIMIEVIEEVIEVTEEEVVVIDVILIEVTDVIMIDDTAVTIIENVIMIETEEIVIVEVIFKTEMMRKVGLRGLFRK